MRVVTVERFGTLTPDSVEHHGYIYEGDGWLFRFVTQSAEMFFRAELPNLCRVLNELDIRAIYKLALYGEGKGLYDVRVYISFQELPTDEQIAQLQFAVSKAEAPGFDDDILDDRLLEFLKGASRSAKQRLAKALEGETIESETN